MNRQLTNTSTAPLLSVRDLTVTFPSEAGNVRAVRGVDFLSLIHISEPTRR